VIIESEPEILNLKMTALYAENPKRRKNGLDMGDF
jgi:hypothetical protein